jgi:hypothetical protein
VATKKTEELVISGQDLQVISFTFTKIFFHVATKLYAQQHEFVAAATIRIPAHNLVVLQKTLMV